MTSRRLTALSKTSAAHRRAHQLPRKRPTNMPLPRSSQSFTSESRFAINKHVSRPLKRKFPSSDSPDPPQVQQLRNENRIGIPIVTGDTWSVRRILTERGNPNTGAREYKIQWDTSWEDASTIQGQAVEEWDEICEDKNATFEYRDSEGGRWTVLKDEVGTENDHEDSQWDMWVAIHRNVVQEVDKSWLSDMVEMDWEYAHVGEEQKMRKLAARYGLPEPHSALAAMQTAWKDLSENPGLKEDEILYGSVRVRYLDALDPLHPSAADHPFSRPAIPISRIVMLLHSHPLAQLDVQMFTRDHDTYTAFEHWRDIVIKLIHTTPFMFKAGTWMQLFALLLLGGDLLLEALAKVEIAVNEDWPTRMREYDIQMYYEKVVDNRPSHDIQETYLCLREFFRELKPEVESDDDDDDDKNGAAKSKLVNSGCSRGGLENHRHMARQGVTSVDDVHDRHVGHNYTSMIAPVTSVTSPGFTPVVAGREYSSSSMAMQDNSPAPSPISTSEIPSSIGSTKVEALGRKDSISKEKAELFARLADLEQKELRQRSFGQAEPI